MMAWKLNFKLEGSRAHFVFKLITSTNTRRWLIPRENTMAPTCFYRPLRTLIEFLAVRRRGKKRKTKRKDARDRGTLYRRLYLTRGGLEFSPMIRSPTKLHGKRLTEVRNELKQERAIIYNYVAIVASTDSKTLTQRAITITVTRAGFTFRLKFSRRTTRRRSVCAFL